MKVGCADEALFVGYGKAEDEVEEGFAEIEEEVEVVVAAEEDDAEEITVDGVAKETEVGAVISGDGIT